MYGELLGAVCPLKDQISNLDPVTLEFLVSIEDAAAARWKQKDQGIWEIRGEPRHFLYSKLMCWVALDRGILLVDSLHASAKVEA